MQIEPAYSGAYGAKSQLKVDHPFSWISDVSWGGAGMSSISLRRGVSVCRMHLSESTGCPSVRLAVRHIKKTGPSKRSCSLDPIDCFGKLRPVRTQRWADYLQQPLPFFSFFFSSFFFDLSQQPITGLLSQSILPSKSAHARRQTFRCHDSQGCCLVSPWHSLTCSDEHSSGLLSRFSGFSQSVVFFAGPHPQASHISRLLYRRKIA